MPRDPMDELIDDLDRVVPAEREQFPQRPSHAEFCHWSDRLLYDRPMTAADLDGTAKRVKLDFEDDPDFQDFLWRFGGQRGPRPRAKAMRTSETPTRTQSGNPEE